MGGMTIMHLALPYPDLFGPQVKGVVLMSTSAGEMAHYSPVAGDPRLGVLEGRAAADRERSTASPSVVERSRKAGSDLGYVVTRRMAFASDVPTSYVELVSEMLGETSLEVVADFYPTFSELDAYSAFEVLGRVPCAVVSGLDDVITPIEHTDKIIELLPGATAIRVEHCGHLGLIEHHETFTSAVEDVYARALGLPSDVPGAAKGAVGATDVGGADRA